MFGAAPVILVQSQVLLDTMLENLAGLLRRLQDLPWPGGQQ
jgi:hypothetical protein